MVKQLNFICKYCKKKYQGIEDSYMLNLQGDRICKECGNNLIKVENKKNPGKLKLLELQNGEKILALTDKTKKEGS